jgi:histidine ammonia-lyase
VGQFRLSVEFIKDDKVMNVEIEKAIKFLQKGKFGSFG